MFQSIRPRSIAIAHSIQDPDDLDFMDGMAVVTVLSRAGLVGAQQAEEISGCLGWFKRRRS
jgi:hypothetical protein